MKHHLIIETKNNCINEKSAEILKDKDDKEKAEEMLQTAMNKAEQIILDAKKEAELFKEKIRQDAYELGYEEGKAEGSKKFESIIQDANNMLKQIIDEKYVMISELEPDIMRVCVKIAEKILKQQIKLDENKFSTIITNAIQKASDTENMNIYVSHEQFDRVNEMKDSFLAKARKVKNIEIFRDEILESLGCLIETDCEVIDLGIMSQIKKIEQAFKIQESVFG